MDIYDKHQKDTQLKKTFFYLILAIISWKLLLSNVLMQLFPEHKYINNLNFYILISGVAACIIIYHKNRQILILQRQFVQAQEKIKRLIYNDYLTGLPNRLALYENITNYISNNPNNNCALILIDSDNFRLINEAMGRSFGDRVISKIGTRISLVLDGKYNLYRVGDDAFIVFVTDYKDIDEVKNCSKKIIMSFNSPLEFENNKLHNTVSAGISIYPKDGNSAEVLVKCANLALLSAKNKGKNKFFVYDETMDISIDDRILIENNLREALVNNEFILHYQPQINIDTKKVLGFEALIRWQNPELGFVLPGKFINIAEDTHLIVPIGEWVLKKSCVFIKDLHNKGYTDLYISVNISIIQLIQDDFVDKVFNILDEVNLEPCYLELEITESILMKSYNEIKTKLDLLRDKGIHIALDDFGQGYSSLNYLKQLPITTLKIDKTFIDDIAVGGKNESITGIIVKMGHKLGLSIVAEGVETAEQLGYMEEYRCDKIQGYYFSKPLEEKSATSFLKDFY